jgi:hypothetical protein
MISVCFDIDDTIWKCRWKPRLEQIPDYDLIQVVRWFHQNGDKVFFWSAGGIDYCQTIINKLGLDEYGKVVAKGFFKPDISFDDEEVTLGNVNVRVNRLIDKPEME